MAKIGSYKIGRKDEIMKNNVLRINFRKFGK
jgi:hypothetical protein